jgi:hypothetical protein
MTAGSGGAVPLRWPSVASVWLFVYCGAGGGAQRSFLALERSRRQMWREMAAPGCRITKLPTSMSHLAAEAHGRG